MLRRETIELIVADCMEKYAKEHSGACGWDRVDIENAVLVYGGEKRDIYAAMGLAMDKCIEGSETEPRQLS